MSNVKVKMFCTSKKILSLGIFMRNTKALALEDVNRRRTTHDDGRQPIAISHLSDSGDL